MSTSRFEHGELVKQLGAEIDPTAAYKLLSRLDGVAERIHALRAAYGTDWDRIGLVLGAPEQGSSGLSAHSTTDLASHVPSQRDSTGQPEDELPPETAPPAESVQWTPSTCIEGLPDGERPDDVAELRHGHNAR